MEIKILSPEVAQFKEKDVQRAFEKDISKLSEDLEFIDTEVVIPVGRIDTLAFDNETNQPVFIEYKIFDFGKDALIQLMDYLSWFLRDRSHYDTLKRIIRHKKPDIEDIESDIKVICVVPNVEERVRNAVYAISNNVLIYSYVVSKDTAGNIVLIHKLEVDNSDVERIPQPPSTEEELIRRAPRYKETYFILKSELLKDGTEMYITGRTIRFRKSRVFALVNIGKHKIRLRLRAGIGNIADPDFKYGKQGQSHWGTITFRNELPDKVKEWISNAREFIPIKEEEIESEAEENR